MLWTQDHRDAVTKVMTFKDFAEPLLRDSAFGQELDPPFRRKTTDKVWKEWQRSVRLLSEGYIHHSIHAEIAPVVERATHAVHRWIVRSGSQSGQNYWNSDLDDVINALKDLRPFEPVLAKIFAPPPPIEEWYTLNVFGQRAVTSLQDEPQFREEFQTLSVRLRHAAVSAGIVPHGSDNEQVYLAIRDRLVGEFGKSAPQADRTPVVEIISKLGQPITGKKGQRRFTKREIEQKYARFLILAQQSPNITREELAKELDVAPGTLYKKTEPWLHMRNFLMSDRSKLPTGYKSNTGEMDAWEAPTRRRTK